MSTFPQSPRVLRGALVGVDPTNPLASVVVFQYNPDTLTRTITPQTSGTQGTGATTEAVRLTGPPQETIKLDITVDATDQLERGAAPATEVGVLPQLAALELLVYPKSAIVIANEVLLRMGVIEIIPPEAPLTLLVWNDQRVLPVRITDFAITEEFFDPALNPIRARVALSLRVLTYRDLGLLSVGGALFMAHQVAKEVLATRNSVTAAAQLASRIGL
jgi:hypothetical protein